jgi:polyphosphate:AMP phosphotransferase
MLEESEGRHKISKKEYHEQEPQLRVDLLNAQYDFRHADFPVLIVFGGDDRPACDEMVDLLHEWMDARYMDTCVFLEPTDEERARPRLWRYWRALPAAGRIGLYLGGWTERAILARVLREIDDDRLEHRLDANKMFERTLADNGALLLKFWFHLPKKEHKKRLKKAKADPSDELKVDVRTWQMYEQYDEGLPVAERALRHTDAAGAPWLVVDAVDREYRNLTVARTILDAITRRLARPGTRTTVLPADPTTGTPLDGVDLSSALDREEYRERLKRGQRRLSRLARKARYDGRTSVLVFEGWDAAGKGGCIRRMTRAMAARDYRLVSIAAPTEEEKAHHYLWRFWRRLPPSGQMVMFDRSWYGRVLVERIEGFAREEEWRRAYREINEFEAQLADHGMPVLKFWLHIDPDEQLRRFQAREKTPYKKYKLTDEDYRNREKWGDYVAAVNEMVERTSTKRAPWHLVPANDKRFARVMVLETVCDALEKAL